MARKLFDLAVKTGEYTTATGETKGRWQNVGAVFEGDKGGQFVMLNRWFNPAGVPDLSGRGGDSILLSCFEPKADGERAQPQQQRQAPGYTYEERPQPQPAAKPQAAARKPKPEPQHVEEEMPF
jgi:hypothetical protein